MVRNGDFVPQLIIPCAVRVIGGCLLLSILNFIANDVVGPIVLKIDDHEIAAFEAKTGNMLWSYKSQSVLAAPAIDGSHIDVAISDGSVIALEFQGM